MNCKLCGKEAEGGEISGREAYGMKCRTCGQYVITPEAYHSELKVAGYLLSAATRLAWDNGRRIEIQTEGQEQIASMVRRPSNLFEAIDNVIRTLYDGLERMDQRFVLDEEILYPIWVACDPNELGYWLNKAAELGYLELEGGSGYVEQFLPTLSGWARAVHLRETTPLGNQAFVAMWFDDSMDDVWANGIKPALERAGYSPMMLKAAQHNDNINDKIMAEIRRSSLVVADFTGQRGGCYFEAGFALGLGIPVVWCCKIEEKEKLHFDTKAYSHIFYSNPANLKELLYDRVQATVPLKKQPPQSTT